MLRKYSERTNFFALLYVPKEKHTYETYKQWIEMLITDDPGMDYHKSKDSIPEVISEIMEGYYFQHHFLYFKEKRRRDGTIELKIKRRPRGTPLDELTRVGIELETASRAFADDAESPLFHRDDCVVWLLNASSVKSNEDDAPGDLQKRTMVVLNFLKTFHYWMNSVYGFGHMDYNSFIDGASKMIPPEFMIWPLNIFNLEQYDEAFRKKLKTFAKRNRNEWTLDVKMFDNAIFYRNRLWESGTGPYPEVARELLLHDRKVLVPKTGFGQAQLDYKPRPYRVRGPPGATPDPPPWVLNTGGEQWFKFMFITKEENVNHENVRSLFEGLAGLPDSRLPLYDGSSTTDPIRTLVGINYIEINNLEEVNFDQQTGEIAEWDPPPGYQLLEVNIPDHALSKCEGQHERLLELLQVVFTSLKADFGIGTNTLVLNEQGELDQPYPGSVPAGLYMFSDRLVDLIGKDRLTSIATHGERDGVLWIRNGELFFWEFEGGESSMTEEIFRELWPKAGIEWIERPASDETRPGY